MLTSELIEALQVTPLYQTFEPQEFDMLIAHSKIITFSPGEIILYQGQKSDGMYIIIEGTALVTAKVLGEGTTQIETLSKGNFLGEISFIEQGPCATTVTAKTLMHCLLVTRPYFDLLALFFPASKNKIIKVIAKQVCERLQVMHANITHFLEESDMETRSLYSDVMESILTPEVLRIADLDNELAEYLRHQKILYELNEEEQKVILQHCEIIRAGKNCSLIKPNSTDHGCYIVLKGAVQSTIIAGGKAAKLAVLGPHSIFNSIGLINQEARSLINYTTCENAILIRLTEKDLNMLHQFSHELYYKIYDAICVALVSKERAADKLSIRLKIESYNR